MTFPTPSGNLPFTEAVTQVPPGTPTSGYFVIPEGEAGQIVNALSTVAHASNPLDLFSLHGLRSAFDDTVQSIKQTISLVTGSQSAWTIIHVNSATQVLAMENAGLKYYPDSASAKKQADAQNRNVTTNPASPIPNPFSGLAAIGDFFNRLTSPHTWLRVGEFIVGAGLLAIGLNALLKQATGHGVSVKTASKAIPLGKAARAVVK